MKMFKKCIGTVIYIYIYIQMYAIYLQLCFMNRNQGNMPCFFWLVTVEMFNRVSEVLRYACTEIDYPEKYSLEINK